MFDRYKILIEHYRKEISNWDWKEIKKEALSNVSVDEDYNVIGNCFIGTVFAVFPSGKYYMPWTSNQTRNDVIRDECFQDALDQVAEENGMYIIGGEGDPCDLFAQYNVSDLKEVCWFITGEDEERAKEILS